MTTFDGNRGDESLDGTDNNDIFNLGNDGEDTVHAAGGDDKFYMGAALDAGDSLDGGTGNDTVFLNGDYSGGLTLGANTLIHIEMLKFAAGHSYDITTDDANVAASATMTINGRLLGASDSLTFNGA